MLVLLVIPVFSENAKALLRYFPELPDVRIAVITQDDSATLDADVRSRFVHFVRVSNALSADAIVGAALHVAHAENRPIHRLIGLVEQLQEPLAAARERLGVSGMTADVARNFRDKTQMKDRLREAGVPVARHHLVRTTEEALPFVAEVGYPIVVKPPAGAASQTTYRVKDEASLRKALESARQSGGGVALLEEFVTGEEHSFDAFMKDGRMLYYSTSNYLPTPLEAMENPWIQWRVVLPREYEYDDMAAAGEKALRVLGLETGMCHMEWFRRKDGSLVISEVGARPGGAQIPTMISRAHDVDCIGAFGRLAVLDEFTPFPPRKYAVGAAFLRGQGQGRVRAVHGLERVERELGGLITDKRLPKGNQDKSSSYEGEGFIVLRHPETRVVEHALAHIISTVRVELG